MYLNPWRDLNRPEERASHPQARPLHDDRHGWRRFGNSPGAWRQARVKDLRDLSGRGADDGVRPSAFRLPVPLTQYGGSRTSPESQSARLCTVRRNLLALMLRVDAITQHTVTTLLVDTVLPSGMKYSSEWQLRCLGSLQVVAIVRSSELCEWHSGSQLSLRSFCPILTWSRSETLQLQADSLWSYSILNLQLKY
jgi:hypothetical protein